METQIASTAQVLNINPHEIEFEVNNNLDEQERALSLDLVPYLPVLGERLAEKYGAALDERLSQGNWEIQKQPERNIERIKKNFAESIKEHLGLEFGNETGVGGSVYEPSDAITTSMVDHMVSLLSTISTDDIVKDAIRTVRDRNDSTDSDEYRLAFDLVYDLLMLESSDQLALLWAFTYGLELSSALGDLLYVEDAEGPHALFRSSYWREISDLLPEHISKLL